jgi:hypothetical protein
VIAVTLTAGVWRDALVANRMAGPHLGPAFGIFMASPGVYLIYRAVRRLGWISESAVDDGDIGPTAPLIQQKDWAADLLFRRRLLPGQRPGIDGLSAA